jgi:hypothetical protein
MSVEFHSPLLRPVAQNQASDSNNPFLSTTRIQPLSQASPLRQVFQTTAEMKTEFAKFLKTIF